MFSRKKSKKVSQAIVLLLCLNQFIINFTYYTFAQDTIAFAWEQTENTVISNISVSQNETYTFESINVKFANLPNENLKLSITKISKQDLPDETNASSDAFDIKLLNDINEEITEGFDISVTFNQIEDTENIAVISFDNIENISEAKLENFEVNDGKIIVDTNHLTIFLVTKIVDHTSGSPATDYIYSNNPTDLPSTNLPATINTKENNITSSSTYIKSRGHWPLVSTNIGNDYIDFYFGDISTAGVVSAISFISNFRIQPNNGSAGISGNVDVNNYNAKLYAKNSTGAYLDLNVNKQDLVPNLSTSQSQLSANYEEITITIDPNLINQIDLTNFVIRYAMAGEHTGNHSGVTGLASYIDSVGLDVSYAPADTTPPTVNLVFPTPSTSATSFQAVFSENVNQTEAENPANYFLNNWPGAGGSGDLVGDATIVYNASNFTSTVTFTNAGWYISPEQQWGVKNIHDLVGNFLGVNPYTAYSTALIAPVTSNSEIDTNWRSTAVTVTLTCADTNGSGCKTTYYTTDGTNPNLTSSTGNSFTLNTEGEFTIKYFSIDNAGNTETVNTAVNTVKIDKTNPGGTILINSGNTYTNNKTVTLAVTSTDNLSGVSKMAFSNDGISYSTLESFSGTKTWDLTNTDETKTVYIKLLDQAGNEFITSDTIILDTIVPVSTITLPSNTGNNTTTYINSWDGVISGTSSDNFEVANVQLSINRASDGMYFNGTSWVTSLDKILLNTNTTDSFVSWNYKINPLENNTYYVTSYAVDYAENIGLDYKLTVIFDTQIPEVALTIAPTNPDGDNDWYVSDPTITLSATDNFKINQIYYQINSTNGIWKPYASPVKINVDGNYKFYYRSMDSALNYSNTKLKNFKLDKTPPDGVTDISAKYENNEVTISWNVEDLSIYKVLIYRGYTKYVQEDQAHLIGTNSQTEEDITDSEVELDNTYYYKLVTIDEAGNVGDTNIVKVVIPATIEEQAKVTVETILAEVNSDTVTQVVENNLEKVSDENINKQETNNEDEQVLGAKDIKENEASSNFNFWWLLLILFPVGLTWWLIRKRQI